MSLRSRLLVTTALGTAAVFLAAGVALHAVVKAQLLAHFDAALNARTRTLAGLVESEQGRIELDFEEIDMAEFRRTDRPEYYQLWNEDGSVLARSASLNDGDIEIAAIAGDGPVVVETPLPDGRPGRLAVLDFTPRVDGLPMIGAPPPPRLRIAVARDVLSVYETLAELRFAIFAVGAAAMLVCLALLAWLVGVGLKPVERVAQSIADIDERRLNSRVDRQNVPSELRPIVDRLNDLLGRLDDAFAREKALTADVAHELRTPLAGLRATLEVALTRTRDAEAYREAMTACLHICTQTQSLVERLLALARLDAGDGKLQPKPIDLERFAREAWEPFEVLAANKQLTVDWSIEPELSFETDADHLQLILRNLFENAVQYANDGGDVCIEGGSDEGQLCICISNTGSRISAEQAAHVFERFWRGDNARDVEGGHAGIGLPLSKQLVERLGGTIAASTSKNGRFYITIEI